MRERQDTVMLGTGNAQCLAHHSVRHTGIPVLGHDVLREHGNARTNVAVPRIMRKHYPTNSPAVDEHANLPAIKLAQRIERTSNPLLLGCGL